MKATITISLLALGAVACGGGEATTAGTTAGGQQPVGDPNIQTVQGPPPNIFDASGNAWQWLESGQWRIRLSVPDTRQCVNRGRGYEGRLFCDYGDVKIEIIAIPRRMAVGDLRGRAVEETNIPPGYWQWQGERTNTNGYAFAEAWSASDGTNTILGVAGHSARADMSHIVFIWGSDAALRSHQGAIERFVTNVYAL